MHGEHSLQYIIVNVYLSCGRARTHDHRVGSHAPFPIAFNVTDPLSTKTSNTGN